MRKYFPQKGVLALLALIIIIGAYLRLHGIFAGLFAYTYDVGRDMLALQRIVVDKEIPLIGPTTGLPGLFYGPWWYYLLVPVYIIGQGNPQAIVISIAFTGVTTILLGYLLGKYIKDDALGIIFAGILSFSFIMIHLTDQIWNPNLAPLFLIILLWLFTLFFRSKKKNSSKLLLDKTKDFLLSNGFLIFCIGVFAGLSIDAEIVYGLLLFICISYFLIYHLFKQKKLVYVLHYSFGLLLIFSPRIFFEFRHDFVMTRHLFSLLHSGPTQSAIVVEIGKEFVKVITALKFLWDETVAVQQPLLGWLFLVATILVIIAYYKTYPPLLRRLIDFSICSVLTYIIGLSFFKGDIWSHYIVGLPVFYIFLFATALATLFTISPSRIIMGFLIFVLMVVYIDPTNAVGYYYSSTTGDASFYRNQVAAIDYVYKEAHGKPFNYAVYTPPIFDYTYQYLFSWYAKKKYGYLPSVEKQQLYFVIIEPDTLYEYRLTHWLDDRAGDGKIIYDRALLSGIRIQKRIH